MRIVKTQLFNALGWVAFGLGIIGLFLPLLPTTPFLLLAAYFFSRGSPRFHYWLIHLKHLGPRIRAWQLNGSIDLRAKVSATVLLVGTFVAFHWFLSLSAPLLILIGTIYGLILLYINTRPNH